MPSMPSMSPMSSSSDIAKIDEQMIASWNAHNVDQGLALCSDNIVWYDVSSPQPYRDKKSVGQYIQAWFSAFPDLKVVTKNRVTSGEWVAGELEFTGLNSGNLQMSSTMPAVPPTGKRVQGKGTYFARIRDGKIIEFHSYPDVAGMMMQLGFMPNLG